jgi:hypothetical protein
MDGGDGRGELDWRHLIKPWILVPIHICQRKSEKDLDMSVWEWPGRGGGGGGSKCEGWRILKDLGCNLSGGGDCLLGWLWSANVSKGGYERWLCGCD